MITSYYYYYRRSCEPPGRTRKSDFFLYIPFLLPKHFTALLSAAKICWPGILGSDLVGLYTAAYMSTTSDAYQPINKDIVEMGQVILGDW